MPIENKSFSNFISTLVNVTKVEYYEKTITNNQDSYKVYIKTTEDSYLLNATE